MLARSAVAALCFTACNAMAMTITFDELPDGMAPADHYAALGVHFDGGVVRHNQFGGYLEGQTRMSFNKSMAPGNLFVDADGYFLDSMTGLYNGNQLVDYKMIESMTYRPPQAGHPTPPVDAYPGKVWPITLNLGGQVDNIDFKTWALDNIRFPDIVSNAGGPAQDLPLPPTLWLVAVGLVALYRRV